MWRIPLAFIVLFLVIYLCHRCGDYIKISQIGGIRKSYNKIFSYLYRLPNSRNVIETKSFVKFVIKDNVRTITFTLSYKFDCLEIKCTMSYKDDTAFDNGKTKEWSINQYNNEDKILYQIKEYIDKSPNNLLG